MLQYLVTSKARRRLLSLLWGEERRGSVAELAGLAGVAFAGAHAEIKAMLELQLVASKREGGREVYAANLSHPDARTLRALVASGDRPSASARAGDVLLRRKLVALGAPLGGVGPVAVPPSERMTILVQGAALARRDAVVARALPLCFWSLRDVLDAKALAALAKRADDKHALGFFLELTGELGGDRRLAGLAEGFRDRRVTAVRPFFHAGRRQVARDFALAVKWGFTMNMDRTSFQTLFDRFER